MSANLLDIEALAATLDGATRTGHAVPQLTTTTDGLTVEQAYQIQHAGIALREGRGETYSGVKLGLTSKAKAAQMGVSDVIIGTITAQMEVPDGSVVDIARGVHPRVEPEVAFRFGEDVPADATDEQVLAAITHVAPALEIIDSRYKDFRFTLVDVVADNTSASGYVIGEWISVADVRERIDLADLPVRLVADGQEVATGSTADILGDPWQAPLDAHRMAAAYGHRIDSGAVLLAGAATAATPLAGRTEVRADVTGLGSVSVRVHDEGRSDQ